MIDQLFQKVKELDRGDYFGELSLINAKPRAGTVKCETDCHLGVIDAKTFHMIKKQQMNEIDKKI